jgi:hypothetical protein
MFKFSGHDINGYRHIGLLAESKGYKGQPEKGFYISNGAGSPWAYQVRPETVSFGAEINGKWYFVGDKMKDSAGMVFFVGFCDGCFVASYPDSDLFEILIDCLMGSKIIGNKWDNLELEVGE